MKAKCITEDDAKIGQRIRVARIAGNLSQMTLAGRLGVSFQQVQKYEKGINRVGGSRLIQIADILGVTVSDLCGKAGDEDSRLLSVMATRDGHRLMTAFEKIKSGADRAMVTALAQRLCEEA